MRNTYVIAAVVALGLVAPVAFYAGQYVSQNNERIAGTSLNQGDGGNGLTGLPGGGGPSTDSYSWGIHKPGGTYGGINIQGRVDNLCDLETLAGRQEQELMDKKGHEEWIDVESYIVPSDWDGMASGKRIHSPLTSDDEPGIMKEDVSTPKLFLSVSHGDFTEEAGTTAMNTDLKVESLIEPGSVTSLTALDEVDPSVGGRIWVNFSLNYMKIQMDDHDREQTLYSAYIELPKSWLTPSLTTDKSTPLLYHTLGANPGVWEIDDNATFELDISMLFDTSVDIVLLSFTHMEDISFTFRHMEQVSWDLQENKRE